jgi:type IV pilus assembly protein PilM
MSRSRVPTWLTPPLVDVAVEITSRRVAVVQVASSGGATIVTAYGSESLPADAVTPAFTGPNVVRKDTVVNALKRAFERAGVRPPKRVALVIPDGAARVSILPFEQLPAKPADLDQLVRWQMKKAIPFPLEEARVSHVIANVEAALTNLAVVVARHDVVAQYEAVAATAGMHAGLVDLASFNVINAVLTSPAPPSADWLLVAIAAESVTLAIMRGASLMSYRQRATVDTEPLSALVHQTAMYYEDRLGGVAFGRVVLCGASSAPGGEDGLRREIADRLAITPTLVDVRTAPALRDRLASTPDVFDTMAAPVGALLRERVA